jgi:SulP family sulfate permease
MSDREGGLGPSLKALRANFHASDVLAGATAAAVLIPQSLAYATLAGMPAERGLYVAALAPIAAALLASSPYLGTGPTAITSLLTFGALSAVATPGGEDFIATAAILALMVGGIRVVLGLVRAGVVAYLMSQPVLRGFTSAAAIVIIASQVPTVVGSTTEESNPIMGAIDVIFHPASWQPAAIGVSIFVAVLMIGGRRIHRLFPAVLIAVMLGIVYSRLAGYGAPKVGSITGGLPPFDLSLPWSSIWSLLIPAAVIGIVGFSEPASIARHYATLERKRWDPNRELISQGIANLAAGLGGGFPAGGSFSRSALVRESGARTRLAGGVTGLTVLLLLPFMGVLAPLPTAVLGTSIILSVIDLIKVNELLSYHRFARLQFAIALVTFVLSLILAPHVERALTVGIVLAVGAHLWRELRLSIPAWTDGEVLHLDPHGVLYFASAPGLEDAFTKLLAEHPEAGRLVVHLGGLGRVDLTGALVLRDLLRDAEEAGLETEVVDVPPQAAKIISRVLGD